MQTATVTDNLTQLTRLRSVNAYLVREEDGFTLIDTMVGGSAGDIIGAAERAGAGIRRIALTHGHGDHVGSLDALKRELGGGVEVLVPELDAQILAGEEFAGKKPAGMWPKVQTLPDVRLAAGGRVGSLEAIPTPGHTPGHVAFLDTRDRTLIAGDVFTSIGGLAVTNHFNLRFPFAAMATWDKNKDLESASALRALEPEVLVVGHGGPLRRPTEAMDKAIARATN
jgi:glyoxylase-like metal-dependent hydrolase (beta-lactamase superfamily II)